MNDRGMNRTEYLSRELRAAQKRAGQTAQRTREALDAARAGLGETAAHGESTDAALVELAGIAADNADANVDIMAALVELADIIAGE